MIDRTYQGNFAGFGLDGQKNAYSTDNAQVVYIKIYIHIQINCCYFISTL